MKIKDLLLRSPAAKLLRTVTSKATALKQALGGDLRGAMKTAFAGSLLGQSFNNLLKLDQFLSAKKPGATVSRVVENPAGNVSHVQPQNERPAANTSSDMNAAPSRYS